MNGRGGLRGIADDHESGGAAQTTRAGRVVKHTGGVIDGGIERPRDRSRTIRGLASSVLNTPASLTT